MLWLGSAETRRVRNDVALELSSNPSALFNSAFTAIEVYIFAFNVNGLPPGLYHYDPKKHSVACLRKGDLQNEVTKMCVGQARAGSGACALAFSGVWKRYMYRYRHPRAYRTLLVNIAELAQKHLILATALSLSTFVTPAFNDELADRLLDVEGFDEAVLELIAFG
jgi:SagB-type dehydrogenase family enzyme